MKITASTEPLTEVSGEQADLAGLEEITRWVLSWGSKAQVISPPELTTRVQDELRAMMRASK